MVAERLRDFGCLVLWVFYLSNSLFVLEGWGQSGLVAGEETMKGVFLLAGRDFSVLKILTSFPYGKTS